MQASNCHTVAQLAFKQLTEVSNVEVVFISPSLTSLVDINPLLLLSLTFPFPLPLLLTKVICSYSLSLSSSSIAQ